MKLRIRNWEKFQHYKFRKPPWIKLYREILDDSDWHKLCGESAKGLIMLWLIASEEDGYLPASDVLAFRLRISENRVIALLSDCSKWFEDDASVVLASCYQDAIPETETETEQSKRRKEKKVQQPAPSALVPVTLWLEFVDMRKKIRKPMTAKAVQLIHRELENLKELGNDPVEVIEQSIRNSWQDVYPVRKDKSNGKTELKSFDAIRREEGDASTRRILERHRDILSPAREALPEVAGRTGKTDLH